MDHNFGASRRFSLGVEEEFQLVGRESYELVSRIDEILSEVEDEDEHEGRVKPELLQSVVEVATNVAHSVDEAMDDLRGLRARLRDAAAERDALTPPRARTVLALRAPGGDRPAALPRAHRGHGLGGRARADLRPPRPRRPGFARRRGRVHELYPDLPARAARALGQLTVLAGAAHRPRVDPHQGLRGVSALRATAVFSSWDEFELLVDRGVKTGSFPDYTYIWWDLRPHPKLGTIELRSATRRRRSAPWPGSSRSCKASSRPSPRPTRRAGAAPAAGHARGREQVARHPRRPRRQLIDSSTTPSAPRGRLSSPSSTRGGGRPRLGCQPELESVESSWAGTGADAQLTVYEETGSLLAVAQWIAEETVRGV